MKLFFRGPLGFKLDCPVSCAGMPCFLCKNPLIRGWRALAEKQMMMESQKKNDWRKKINQVLQVLTIAKSYRTMKRSLIFHIRALAGTHIGKQNHQYGGWFSLPGNGNQMVIQYHYS